MEASRIPELVSNYLKQVYIPKTEFSTYMSKHDAIKFALADLGTKSDYLVVLEAKGPRLRIAKSRLDVLWLDKLSSLPVAAFEVVTESGFRKKDVKKLCSFNCIRVLVLGVWGHRRSRFLRNLDERKHLLEGTSIYIVAPWVGVLKKF
jgi:hypothetical protein